MLRGCSQLDVIFYNFHWSKYGSIQVQFLTILKTDTTPQKLSSSIYRGLVRGSLCDVIDEEKHIFSFYKPVKESLKLFDYGDPESENRRVVRYVKWYQIF